MQASDRIMKIKSSPTLAVTALANSLKSKGVDVIGFGSGEPDFDTPQHIKDAAITAIKSGKTKYTPSGGISELIKAVGGKFRRDNNLEYKSSEIIISSGGKHSLYNLIQVTINPKDEVIIPSPYWVSYPSIVELADGVPVIIKTSEENGFKLTPDQLKKAINKKTKAVILNSPSNPTGCAYTKEELSALGEILVEKDVFIITDDIYESIIYDDFEFYNIANISDELKKKTIVVNGVSKAYSMTGWRIGYMAGNEEIIKKVDTIQSQSTSNPASISQWAAVEALDGDQSVVKEMVAAFQRRRKLIVDGLNEIPPITCINPDGAFYAFPGITGLYKLKSWKSLKEKYKTDSNSSAFSSYLIEEARVAVVPGIAFGNDDHIRLSFATSDNNIIEGIKRIKTAVEQMG